MFINSFKIGLGLAMGVIFANFTVDCINAMENKKKTEEEESEEE